MGVIDLARWDLAALAQEWKRARPFSHVVVDGLLSADDHASLARAFAWEPHYHAVDEIYSQLRSATPPVQPVVRAFHDALTGPAVRAAVAQLSGKPLSGGEGAGYVYLERHYLLPHADHREHEGRSIAFAYYVASPGSGGELELYACTRRAGAIVRTRVARRIEPVANRLVLFDVSADSLHRVAEVRSGARQSVAGWYFA